MSTPQLPPPKGSSASFLWLYFGFAGRINREVYWLGIGLLWSVLFVLVGMMIDPYSDEGMPGGVILLAIPSLWCEMALLVKRQHDRGLPWYWCLLAFIPLAGAVWMVLAGLVAGNPGPNAYGERANEIPE
ncbi:DUF805 domain-containing protein [Microbaculum marinum]|uniref:DUF805 domain-containing protein n=1 Tax=Microbaculum marinum TaxID=1764581 RepID=A0AAW9RBN0_9HYPH